MSGTLTRFEASQDAEKEATKQAKNTLDSKAVNPATVFLLTQYADKKARKCLNTQLDYSTWDGSPWRAEVIETVFHHTKIEGESQTTHTDDHIDYLTIDGSKWRAKLVETCDGLEFFHSPEGNEAKGHQSKCLDYIGWDGGKYRLYFAQSMLHLASHLRKVSIKHTGITSKLA